MRFSLAVAVVLVGISGNGLAQQTKTFKVKPSHAAKAPRSSAPLGKASSTSASKDLQNLERQTAKASAPSRTAVRKRTPGAATALKPAKDKPNPPINFSGTGGSKSPAMTHQGSNPYKGRLRQKHARQ